MNPKVLRQECAWYLPNDLVSSAPFLTEPMLVCLYFIIFKNCASLLQSLAYFPFAIVNALTARLDDGFELQNLLYYAM
jgi:hypothetical protein